MKINQFSPLPSFRKGIKKFAGRNNTGQITVRHRGGGHKQNIRPLDWQPNWAKSIVVGFDYDPQRTTSLVQLYHKPTTTSFTATKAFYSYQISTQNVKPFQRRTNFSGKKNEKGDMSSLSSFEPGDFVHSVELYPGQGASVARSAGSFCQIRSSYSGGSKYRNTTSDRNSSQAYVKVRLPSGSQRLISSQSQAVFGVPEFDGYHQQSSKKAGRTRWYGWRPSVRGVARNPVDHPHGGGQGKTSGGRPSVTFKAWPTKGQPTRSPKRKNNLIVFSRKKRSKLLMSRSIWKFSVYNPISKTTGDSLFFQNRASLISERRVNYRIYVYNGQRWYVFRVSPERVGHRVGEFAPTRKRPIPKKKKQVKTK